MSLRQLYELDRSSPQFPEQVNTLLHDPQLAKFIEFLPPGGLGKLTCYLDNILHDLHSTGATFRKCLYVLKKVCSSQAILPPTYEVSPELSISSDQMVTCGGFCDVYKGTLGPGDVCVKRFRISSMDSPETVKKALHREAVVWRHLIHPNIVPFRGATFDPLQLVSDWMSGGELRHYVNNNPDANLIGLLLDVAEGLNYLHSCGVIHGDLKGANILIDGQGNARLVDFGFATVARDPISLATVTNEEGYTPRFAAPEILMGTQRHSKGSDVFAFGMVIIEIFTGKVPFRDFISAAATTMITRGDRPGRPTHSGFTDGLWTLTQECWRQKPQERPEMGVVINRLSPYKLMGILPGGPIDQLTDENLGINTKTPTTPTNFGSVLFPPGPLFLPHAPVNFFGRDAILDDLLGFAERLASFTLSGPGGIGKTAIALTLLHHSKIATKFGTNRHFLCRDDFESSSDGFLGSISKAVGAHHPTNVAQLLSHLTTSYPCIVVLDDMDPILDAQGPEAAEVTNAIEELGRCDQVCLITTSRLDIKIPGFRHIDVPALPAEAAQDTFHKYCDLGRSAKIDHLLAELGFHSLSVVLLACATDENGWDEARLLEAWNYGKTSILKASGHRSLEENIESTLRTPSIQAFGTVARETLEGFAVYPHGVKEIQLLSTFPGIHDIGNVVNTLCKFSLMYRHDGILNIHSPFRIHFQHTRRVESPGAKTRKRKLSIKTRLLNLLRTPGKS